MDAIPLPVVILVVIGALSFIVLLFSQSSRRKAIESDKYSKQSDKKLNFLGTLSKEEVANHATAEDAWIIVDKKVYDVSAYVGIHPGGMYVLQLGSTWSFLTR